MTAYSAFVTHKKPCIWPTEIYHKCECFSTIKELVQYDRHIVVTRVLTLLYFDAFFVYIT